jgi:hypothetical protein
VATRFWIRTGSLAVATLFALVPAAGLSVRFHDGQGERFLYLASAPLCIAIACVIGFLLRERWAAVTVLALLAVAAAWALDAPTRRWDVAGRVASEVVEALRRESQGRELAILNLPDNYEGAYVFRNGLHEALNSGLRLEERFTVDVLSRFDIDHRPAEVELGPNGPRGWRFAILSSDGPLHLGVESLVRPAPDRRSFVVPPAALAGWSDVYVFEGSSMRRVDRPGSSLDEDPNPATR